MLSSTFDDTAVVREAAASLDHQKPNALSSAAETWYSVRGVEPGRPVTRINELVVKMNLNSVPGSTTGLHYCQTGLAAGAMAV